MRTHEKAEVTISAGAQKTLLLDIYKRQRIEACGLLVGGIDDSGNWHVEETFPLRNIFDSPTYFEFAPEDLLAADLAYPGRVIGAYHSHPTGLAVASHTDRQNMKRINVDEHIPWVWLIVCGPFDHAPTFLQQIQRHIQRAPNSSIIAYHHFEDEGLLRITIRFEGPAEVQQDKME
ncbi:MAG TPA: Mov34/MPN/PAD-1 family protein [Ktedonobacteraceae bacterium]